MNEDLKKKTVNNVIFAFLAQFISILLSTLMSLVVPKVLGVEDYSYWQLFLFYITYVGFFHFGITDGMYLINGGKEEKELNVREISSQFWMLFIIQIILNAIIISISIICNISSIRKFILILASIYMLIANLNWFLGYIFQAINKVKVYSMSVMIDKIVFLIFVVVALFLKIRIVHLFMIIYIITRLISLIYTMIKAKKIILTKPYDLKTAIKVSYESSKIGINLTLASISSLLILGIGRFLIDKVWGITSFGKFSFALSLTNFFLLFIGQVSMVLFPTLRQIDEIHAKQWYSKLNNILNIILPIIYIVYIPIKLVLAVWLPQYEVSLKYLAILLPICTFDGKMQMISNTYYKVLREEKSLLKVNIISLVLSILFSIIGVYIIKNIYAVIVGMILAISIRSIISELYLTKKMNVKSELKGIISLIIISLVFVICTTICSDLISLISTTCTYIIYIVVFNRNSCIATIKELKKKYNTRKEVKEGK